MARNPLNYTYRTYGEIYQDLKSKYPDKPEWFIQIIAGAFDVAHWYLDARAQDLTLPSAFTPEAMDDLLSYIDYYRASSSPAGGAVAFTVTAPKTVAKEDLVVNVTNASGRVVRYEALEDHTFTLTTENVYLYEGESVTDSFLGSSDGSTSWQEYTIPDTSVLPDTVVVKNASLVWEQKTTLVNSLSTDRHFRIVRRPGGFFSIVFGNDEYGQIPLAGGIEVSYRRGGGSAGNVKTATSTIAYSGSDSDVTGVAFVEDFNGGSEEETYENARFMAPQMIKRNDRAITERDYELLALNYSTGVKQARCFPGLYGEGTVGLHIVPAGGGNPSGGLKIGLQDYLRERSVLGLTDVRVRDPIYVTENITYAIFPRSASFAVAKSFADLAAYLLLSETVKEVLDTYEADGVAQATTLINTLFSFSFNATDYPTIIEILERRLRDGINTWGSGLRRNDIISAIDSLPQVDYMTLAVPAADVNITSNQILTPGTITGTLIV